MTINELIPSFPYFYFYTKLLIHVYVFCFVVNLLPPTTPRHQHKSKVVISHSAFISQSYLTLL